MDNHEKNKWNKSSAFALINHILEIYHEYIKGELPRIDNALKEVIDQHDEFYEDLLCPLQNNINMLKTEINEHLIKEEQILFPAIKEMEAYVEGKGVKPELVCG